MKWDTLIEYNYPKIETLSNILFLTSEHWQFTHHSISNDLLIKETKSKYEINIHVSLYSI